MKIKLVHARSMPCRTGYGLCSRGQRKWAEKHGIDWEEYVSVGIDEEVFLATGDAMAAKLVKWAKQNGS